MCNGSLRIPPADFCVPRRSPWPRRASVVGSGCGIYRRIAGSDRFASSLAASCISSGEWAPPVPNAGDSDADLKSKTHQNWGWAERKKKWNENTTTGSESLQIFTNSRTKCCLNKKICVKFSESVHYAYVCVWVRVSVCVCVQLKIALYLLLAFPATWAENPALSGPPFSFSSLFFPTSTSSPLLLWLSVNQFRF